MRRPTVRTWILIADGARARLFLNEGPGRGLRSLGEELEGERRPTRELGTERPGRVRERADVTRHAYEPRVDWHEFEKHLFVKEIAAVLDAAAARRRFDRLVLVAPPKTLGALRRALGELARSRVSAELKKDLVNVSEHDLPVHLGEIVRL